MLLIQQTIATLNKLTESFNCLVTQVKSLFVSSSSHEQALCNHKLALESIRADILALDAKIAALPEPTQPEPANPISTATAIIPNNANQVTVLLPLNIEIISVLIVNTTVNPTEEIGLSNFIVTTNISNTILAINLSGISNADTFNALVKYIQL
jgi:hypothetical protein